ncbi:hypothetical protein DL95DRAFT_458882 [Leptodontidium sp. 2 PMI_412]|nr:hypothetical protein DL95DRAFT_458882 [Leptodontidium sp. 2 PMI_412]
MDPFITRLLKVFAQYLCLYYYIDAIAWTIGPTDNLIYPANPTLFRDFAAIILFCAVMLQFSIARHYFEQISLIAETDSIGIREVLGLKVVLTPIAEVSSFSLFVGLLGRTLDLLGEFLSLISQSLTDFIFENRIFIYNTVSEIYISIIHEWVCLLLPRTFMVLVVLLVLKWTPEWFMSMVKVDEGIGRKAGNTWVEKLLSRIANSNFSNPAPRTKMSTSPVSPIARSRPKRRNRNQPPISLVPATDATTDPAPTFRSIVSDCLSRVLQLALYWITSTPLYKSAASYYFAVTTVLISITTRTWIPACIILALVAFYFGLASFQVLPVAILCFALINVVLAFVHALFAVPRVVQYLSARPSRILYTVCCGVLGIIVHLCWRKMMEQWYLTKEPPLVFLECGLGMRCLE